MEIVQAAILKKFQTEIAVALALIFLSAGIGYNAADDEPYNPYESRVDSIDKMMQNVITNPTDDNLGNMQTDIFYTYYPWAERQTEGEQNGNYIAYLEACNQVVISLSKEGNPGLNEKINVMNEKRAVFE